ncbi:hypothetical protein V499_00148 [Pseudogymnoascus sp. VKM F-103]|nr:hypothetical protein V499_00148 [Pseudogymnoascus sp. VKM F-103]
MAPQVVNGPSLEAYLAQTARSTYALPFESTPMGYPKIIGRTWDPVIGSRPFTIGSETRTVLRSTNSTAIWALLKMEHYSQALTRGGQTIYDAARELITIHGQVMHGSAYDDRRRPSGRTTERDYMVEHLEPRRENHQDAINEYNNVILNEACFRIEDRTALYQEHLFVQHAIGEGSDAGYPTDLGSTSDDEFDFGSDFGYSSDPDYQSKNTGAMHNGAMTISAAAAEERAAQRIRDRERERTVNHDSMIDGMWRASLKFIMATLRQISCAGQSIRPKALRTIYFNRLEAELMEALTYIQKKFGLVNAEDITGFGGIYNI